MKRTRTSKRDALIRGLRKRCPHCGDGPLFRKGAALHPRCSACGLKFQLNPGDPWAFLLLIDRAAVVFPIIVAIYFGLFKLGFLVFSSFILVLVVSFVVTTPNRYGLCVALDYLTRVYWGDPSDVLPELPPARDGARFGSGIPSDLEEKQNTQVFQNSQDHTDGGGVVRSPSRGSKRWR